MISKAAALGLLLLPAARAPGSLITDGDFADGGPAVSDGTGWAKVDISDCPCAATGGLMVRPSAEGSAAYLRFNAHEPAGVFVLETLAKLSTDYVDGPAIYAMTAFSGDVQVAHAETEHVFFNASQRFAAWHLYTLQLVCPSPVTSLVVRIGSGAPSPEAAGSFNTTAMSLTFAGGSALPVLSGGLEVTGPTGQFSRLPSLVTDGVTLRPPLNTNHWKVVAFVDRLKQLELDLGEEKTVCGARLTQTDEFYAARWSMFGTSDADWTGVPSGWTKIVEAVPDSVLAAAGSERGCTGAWEGEAGCSLATAYTGPATTVLWPCRRARFLRLDLQEPNDCCYQILEWETLGLGSDAVCAVPCLNGGRCAIAAVGAEPLCSCPREYGWRGADTGCTEPTCRGGCRNGGTCVWADTCDCAPGYYGQSCTAELCGDGAQSHSEICDDGNAVGNDGCVRCDLENNDPALVWPSNTSLAEQWYTLYPPLPPPPPQDVDMSFVDTGNGGGLLVGAMMVVALTQIFACCYFGAADDRLSEDQKKELRLRHVSARSLVVK